VRRLVPLLAAFPLVLSACGGDTVAIDPVAHAAVVNAAKITARQKGAYVSMTGTISASGVAGTFSAEGVEDIAGKRGSMHFHFDIGSKTADMDEVFSSFVMYIDPKGLFDVPQGKKWLKVDLRRSLNSAGLDTSGLDSADASKTLDQLAASGEVTKLGEETLAGVQTTHYRARTDPSKVPNAKKLEALDVEYGPTEVWIDRQSRVRRMKVEFAYKVEGERLSLGLTTEFSRFGAPVFIDIPAEKDVYDGTDAGSAALKEQLKAGG
jgi:hypothetical protein